MSPALELLRRRCCALLSRVQLITQAAKFDPEAIDLKRCLPEPTDLPAKLLLEPCRDPGRLAAYSHSPSMVAMPASRHPASAMSAWPALRAQGA